MLSENIIQKEKLPRLTNKRTGINLEKSFYINLQSPLASKEQIDREAEQFIADVQQAAEESTPPNKGIIRSVISYPVEIKELVLAKRSARRKWQQSRYPDDKTKFNRLSNQLKKRIREIKNESINRFLNNLTADKSTEYSL